MKVRAGAADIAHVVGLDHHVMHAPLGWHLEQRQRVMTRIAVQENAADVDGADAEFAYAIGPSEIHQLLDLTRVAQGRIACRRIGAGFLSARNDGVEIMLVSDFPAQRINVVGGALAHAVFL